MSWRRRLALACGAWLLCGVAAAAAVDTLEACAARASPDATGLAALEAQCTGLEAALLELEFPAVLPEQWRDTITPAALRDLVRLAQRYAAAPPRASPDTGALTSILEQMAREQVKPERSWWRTFREWLRGWLAERSDGSSPWLDRVLESLAQSADLIKVISWFLLAVVVIGAVSLLVRELRAAGLLSGGGEAAARAQGASLAGESPELRVEDLDALALHDRPALLLRLLVARLLSNGQLHADRSLTHRELVTHSRFADGESRGRFERVSQMAERVLYGSADVDAAQVGVVVGEGRALLSQLQAPAEAG